jgi:hypothetical protein
MSSWFHSGACQRSNDFFFDQDDVRVAQKDEVGVIKGCRSRASLVEKQLSSWWMLSTENTPSKTGGGPGSPLSGTVMRAHPRSLGACIPSGCQIPPARVLEGDLGEVAREDLSANDEE